MILVNVGNQGEVQDQDKRICLKKQKLEIDNFSKNEVREEVRY